MPLAAKHAPPPALPRSRREPPPVFSLLERGELGEDAAAGFGREIYRQRFVRARTDLAEAETLLWNLFDDLHLRAERSELVEHAEDASHYTWRGRIEGDPHSEVVALVRDGRLTASIALSNGTIFTVDTLPSGVQRVREGNERALPGCGSDDHTALAHPTGSATTQEAGPPPPGAAASAAEAIDLLFLYTPEAVAILGAGVTGLEDRLALNVEWVNVIYQNTGVEQRLRVAGMVEVAYDDSHRDGLTALEDVTFSGDGQLEQAPALRDDYGADMVALVIRPSDVCGIAWVAGVASEIGWYEDYMFSVVNVLCTGNGKTLAHELGHNQGGYHDPATELAAGMSQAEIDAVPPPNSFGYVDPADLFHTTMAYSTACGGCLFVQQFSTPLLTYQGRTTGSARSNLRSTLEATHLAIATFRESTLCSGSGDLDGDGFCDNLDNCSERENPDQFDADLDGYGNACDGDYDGNGFVGVSDFSAFSGGFGRGEGDARFDARFDHNGDGAVGFPDWSRFGALFGGNPGPSGLACAGTPPCTP